MEGKQTANQGEPSSAPGPPLATTTSLPTPSSSQWHVASQRMAGIEDDASDHFGQEGNLNQQDGEEAQRQQQQDPTTNTDVREQETEAEVKDEDEKGR